MWASIIKNFGTPLLGLETQTKHSQVHITPKSFLHLVFSQTPHAWIHGNICNTSPYTPRFSLVGAQAQPPTRSLALILSRLSAAAMYVYINTGADTHTSTQTHTLPQASL